MAKFKEIEIKWDASIIDRKVFNLSIRKLLFNKYRFRFLHTAGYDYYYTAKTGEVARHRFGDDTNELTVKARLSKRSTTIRKETNLKLSKEVSPLEVQEAMVDLGFSEPMRIYKDCDIYIFKDGKYTVDIVWYKTSGKKKNSGHTFIEVEVHNAPVATSLHLLKKWTSFVESLGLKKSDIVHSSLYEIYSGKKYKMVKRKGD